MPRCKNCKEKFEPIRFNQKYCLNKMCVDAWVQEAKVKNWQKKKKENARGLRDGSRPC